MGRYDTMLFVQNSLERRREELGIKIDPDNFDPLWKSKNPIEWLEIIAKDPEKYVCNF